MTLNTHPQISRRAAVAALALTVLVGGSAGANARPKANPSFAGTWSLVAADSELPGGERVHAYGDHPVGRMMIDNNGRYAIQIFRGDRARFASGDRATGTPEEYRAALTSMSTNYGRITVDWAKHLLVMEVQASSDPNWKGAVDKRPFTFDGQTLFYRIPVGPNEPTPISIWRRDK